MKKLRYIIIAFTGILAFGACHSSEKKEQAGGDADTYKTTTVKLEKLDKNIRLPGELKPYEQVDIYAKVSSFVKEVLVDRGSQVKKGDVLAILDAPELEAQLADASAKLRAAQSSYLEKKAIYASTSAEYKMVYKTSLTPGTVSANDLQLAFAKMTADSSQMEAAGENVEAAKSFYQNELEMKNYLTVTAPFSGTITERNVHPGALVGPASKATDLPILKLDEDDRLRLVVAVPEAYTGGILDKQPVEFSVKAYPDEVFKAIVNREAGSLNMNIRSEMIEMDVFTPDKKLKPGMYAEVKLETGRETPTLVIPKTSLVLSTERSFVIVVKDGKAYWVDVIKGNDAGDSVEVFGPIKTGDIILLKASDEIENGKTVKVSGP